MREDFQLKPVDFKNAPYETFFILSPGIVDTTRFPVGIEVHKKSSTYFPCDMVR